MHFLRRICSCRRFLVVLTLGLAMTACRKPKPGAPPPPKVAVELKENRIGDLAGPVYQSQAHSPIHWQPWTPQTLQRAKDARRLIFVAITMPRQPGYRLLFDEMGRDPGVLKTLNNEYVPILLDGEAAREIALLTADLSNEIKQQLEMPMFVWMTDEQNPVAWIPVSPKDPREAIRMFHQSNEMVSRMWSDDTGYVLNNSKLDNDARNERFRASGDLSSSSEAPAADSLQAIRQLNALYDSYSRSLDESGGLFPAGVMDALLAAGYLPTGDSRSRETSQKMMEDLLQSAMFDPLEGGVFSGRGSASWSLPNFVLSCVEQARISVTLFRCHQLTGNALALQRALSAISFCERRFQAEDGLFFDGAFGTEMAAPWLWTIEEIEKELPKEDAQWWIAATGMSAMGNLPAEIDPQRQLFRRNSLAFVRPLAETAEQLKVPVEEFTQRFEKSRDKLAEVRRQRFAFTVPDRTTDAETNFRMVSAYCGAFAATGDVQYRSKALSLLAKTKAKFTAGKRMSLYGKDGPAGVTEGRAFLYALAVQTVRDVCDVTMNETEFAWAEEVAGTATELFAEKDFVREVSKEAQLIDLPISDRRKIFDDTTTGLFLLTRSRISAGEAPTDSALERLPVSLPKQVAQRPIFFTDSILASLVEYHGKSLLLGKNLPDALKNEISRLPFQLVARRVAKDSDGVPTGSVRVISPDGTVKLIADAAALREELSLRDQKP